VSAGSATITVTTADGSKTATCAVTVTAANVAVTGVTLNITALSLDVGGLETLIATVAPANATNKNVTWSSSAPSIATVSNGTVTAVAGGSATITVTTADGSKIAICVVTVTAAANVPVTGVSLNKTSLSLFVGDTETLIATVAPSNATNKNVTWSITGYTGVITVSSSGVVIAVSAGNATINVSTADGNKRATCTVTVTAFNVSTLASYLATLPENTVYDPYNISLKFGSSPAFQIIRDALNEEPNKYVYIDLSGSTVPFIPDNAFYKGNPLFSGCKTLCGITIPSSITSINSAAFNGCYNLRNIIIPDSVTSIGESAFGGCSSLTSVIIPNSVTSIGASAFAHCTFLENVTIGSSVTSIGRGVFMQSTKLTSVTFLSTIPSSGFSNDLTYLVFPGDLRAKFYATNSSNGTPGTYTRASGGETWTKQ
jgi:hypothetical protein